MITLVVKTLDALASAVWFGANMRHVHLLNLFIAGTDEKGGKKINNNSRKKSLLLRVFSTAVVLLMFLISLIISQDMAGASVPIPNVTANGSEEPITLSTNGTLIVTVGLDVGTNKGVNADWWFAVDTPFEFYWYAGTTWTPSTSVAYQGPLSDIDSYEILNINALPIGTYTFYFGVDTSMDGLLNHPLYYDSVVVKLPDQRSGLLRTYSSNNFNCS